MKFKEEIMATITIDGIKIEALDGEYILEVARSNNIFIPSICYLSKCSPTLACKMCMVDINGKRAYACNAKVKDGLNVTTKSNEIDSERKAIMQSYAINHPLECGVCDKSGECELQDFVHLVGVDNQDYFIADSFKKMDYWSQVKYDPNLCILCERCVTTCKDNLGEANIKAIKQDYLPAVDAAYWKDKMPKDAFSVWSRKQKSLIGFVGDNPCNDCAECASVCPVGALGVKSFQYTSNAWELNKIDSTCTLCPSGCKITYEVKKDLHGKVKIYRVTNDFNFNPICGGGRFAYDIYHNESNNNISDVAIAFKQANHIVVGGNTTNNEAILLEKIREKTGIKLINNKIYSYQEFLNVLIKENIPLAKIDDISNAKLIWSIGCDIKYENPLIRYKINNTLKMSKESILIYSHPLEDLLVSKLSKKYKYLKYAPHKEEILILFILLILDPMNSKLSFLEKYAIDINIKSSITKKVIEIQKDDNGNEIEVTKDIKEDIKEVKKYYSIFEDNGLSYDMFIEFRNLLENKPLIIIGEDVYNNPNKLLIADILSSLKSLGKIDILLNPPSPNANGIIANLTLDKITKEEEEKYHIGFRQKGTYTIDSINADFNIPFYHSLNDNIINIDNRILPIYAALPCSNYIEILADILEISLKIEPKNLDNYYNNKGENKRGILLETISFKETDNKNITLDTSYNEKYNAYIRDMPSHFFPYTQFSSNLQTNIGIYVSNKKLKDLKNELNINIGDKICLESNGIKIYSRIFVDNDMNDDYFAISPQIKNAEKIFNGKYSKVTYIQNGNI